LAKSQGAELLHLSFPIPMLQGRFDCKTVVSLHDLYPYDCPEVFGYPNVYFNRMFLQLCLRHSDAIACVSTATYQRALELFPESVAGKLSVIPNCFVPTTVSPEPPANFHSVNFVLAVAQHRHNKNLPLAIEGFGRMLEQKLIPEDCMFVVVGCEGPATEQIRETIVSRGLAGRLKLLSSLRDNELQWLYQHCSLFLAASSTEGFCLPLLEAMAAGCRIACSDIPAHREIGSSSCHYFGIDGTVEGLVMAAAEALEEQRAHEELSRFSPDVIGDQYMNLYRGLLSPVMA
ncbi:MAG TPA: glycosyltransferase family 1 protein, partial [Nitrospira sp.]|nr:glycosyltransferase family 1 protein [Nitrospira sp.]